MKPIVLIAGDAVEDVRRVDSLSSAGSDVGPSSGDLSACMSKNRGASGLKPTVLFADGDAVWRNICLTFLGDCGYTVETASSGLECIEILRRRTPAIVVVDFQLPWGGGDGVLAWLRSETFSPEAPVILTADARFAPGLFQDIEPSGVQILIKPYSVTTLLEFLLAAEACNDGRNENRRRAPFARHAM